LCSADQRLVVSFVFPENLFLNNNEFIGSFPSSIGMATGLRNMDISFNFFTGSLPVEFATLRMLERFGTKDNALTGPFFDPFGAAWSNLEHLNLDGTQFIGTIPAAVLITWASSMIDMTLGYTLFHGNLPSEIGALTKLTGLNINGPKLQGPVPDLSKLTNLGKCRHPRVLLMTGCFQTHPDIGSTWIQRFSASRVNSSPGPSRQALVYWVSSKNFGSALQESGGPYPLKLECVPI
jgi:hypothetical protein